MAMHVVAADLFFVALLSSCCLLGLAFCSPDLLIGICHLPHQICLRRAALGSSVLAELTLDGGTLSLGSRLQESEEEEEKGFRTFASQQE